MAVNAKLNKETLEASFAQIEYLKGIKKDQMAGLCKMFDGKVTAEDVEEIEKLFKSLDVEEKNEMPVNQLGNVLRMLQQVPTEEEIVQLIETVNPKKADSQQQQQQQQQKADPKKADPKKDKSGKENPEEVVETIDFFKYMLALGLFLRDPQEIASEVKKAFKVLDRRNNGYLMAADLRDFLSKLGDVLTDEEIDEMIKIADTESNGQINYDQFVDMMTEMKPGGGKKKKGKKGKKGKKKGKK